MHHTYLNAANVTPLQREFREILSHVAAAQVLASNADMAGLLETLRALESSAVDVMFDHSEEFTRE